MKKIAWGGLSDDNKKELSNFKVLNGIYNKAIFEGFTFDVYYYMTEILDPYLFIDLLKELDVHFVKEEEDLILDEDEEVDDNITEIAEYICDEIDRNKSNLDIDVNKIAEMGEKDLEDFFDNIDPLKFSDILLEYLTKNQNVKKDFVTFCIRKFQESDNK